MNLDLYNSVRAVPPEAQKEIQAGRLRGKTDINPMWRIKTLTEQFGPCGIGWKYVITEKSLDAGANEEIAAFVDINLYIKHNGEWSEAIPGTGGSMFVTKETKGLYTSDECFKMALTDAISVACKALGIGADVYWEKDSTKYSRQPQQGAGQGTNPPPQNNPATGQSDDSDPVQKAANTVIQFGKHKGKTLGEIYKEHPDYVTWFLDKGQDAGIKTAFQTLHKAVEDAKKSA